MVFDITGKTLKPVSDARSSEELEHGGLSWLKKGERRKPLSHTSDPCLPRRSRLWRVRFSKKYACGQSMRACLAAGIFTAFDRRPVRHGTFARVDCPLRHRRHRHQPRSYLCLHHNVRMGTSRAGSRWIGDALRVMIDRAGQRAPTPDYPISDAMLQVMVPLGDGSVRRKGVRINYICRPLHPMVTPLLCVSPTTARPQTWNRAVWLCFARTDFLQCAAALRCT